MTTKVLITGANGLIGNLVYAHFAAQPERYEPYGTARRAQPSDRVLESFHQIPEARMRVADLVDFEAVQAAVAGMDVVVHMAADASSNGGWESVLNNNIIATHNIFEASRQANVKRVIFASTNQVVFGYGADEPYKSLFEGRFADVNLEALRPVTHMQPTRPLNDYAASKVYGEGLAHLYAHTHNLSSIVLRIGWVTGDDTLPGPRARILWCSQRDIVQLVERCVNAPASLRFDVFFGQSNNLYNLVDIQHAKDVLGYAPLDGAEARLI